MERSILHIDVNNAFLSWTAVEKLKSGEEIDIRTIPSVIGGDEAQRHGVVLAKSPVAKQFGIKTGEPLYFARKKCDRLQVFPVNFNIYKKYSNAMIEIFKEHTNVIEQFSIDECFLDLTGFLKPGENLLDKAHQISKEIKEKLEFTVNIGVSTNKLLAKMASDFEKPDKVHTLYPNEIKEKMWGLDVGELFMVGRKTKAKLEKLNINTIGDLANTNQKEIIKRFGKLGKTIWEYANGIDNSPVQGDYGKVKGVGNSITLPQDVSDINKLEEILLSLAEQVSYRLRKQEMVAKVVNVQIKTSDFKTSSHQRRLYESTDSTKIIYNEGKKLLEELHKKEKNKQVRLIGLRVDNLEEKGEQQISIFDLNNDKNKHEKLDEVIDSLKNRYGYNSVTRAGQMNIERLIK